MENEALFNEWLIGLVLVSLIIVIAAVLLILVFLAAKRILRLAGELKKELLLAICPFCVPWIIGFKTFALTFGKPKFNK